MLNVLIVDDEAPIRHWLEYCVNQLDGFWVSATAKNGLQGIEEYKKTLPDIVITDVEMPNMSGLDMLKTIREIKPAYIIVLTSYDSFAYAREALVVGASEYILKTEISVESLRAVLNKAAGVLYKQNRDAKSEVEQSGQMMLRQLAMVGTQLSLTPDILRRKGITLDENLLVWSDKVGYVWLAISLDPVYVDTGNRIESATALCYECLNDIALDVFGMTGNDHDFEDADPLELAEIKRRWKPYIDQLPEYAYLCDELLSGRK